jgi:hypothetical protein
VKNSKCEEEVLVKIKTLNSFIFILICESRPAGAPPGLDSHLILFLMTNSIDGQMKNKKALLVIDVQENLLNPDSSIHIDKTASTESFFDKLNQ